MNIRALTLHIISSESADSIYKEKQERNCKEFLALSYHEVFSYLFLFETSVYINIEKELA